MTEKDFYDLKIGQKLYSKEDGELTISGLIDKEESPREKREIYFTTLFDILLWDEVCHQYSLEAPKEKKIKRLWQWKLKDSSDRWFRCDVDVEVE